MKIGKYTINIEKGRLVARSRCSICSRPDGLCSGTTATATPRQLDRLLAGKLTSLSDLSVTYAPKSIKIGCTRVPRSKLKEALALLEGKK